MSRVRLGIVGVGNCASSLLQGIEYYRDGEGPKRDTMGGLMHLDLAGYRPGDIQVVCAFDIDERKAGKPLEVAALAPRFKVTWAGLLGADLGAQLGDMEEAGAAWAIYAPAAATNWPAAVEMVSGAMGARR